MTNEQILEGLRKGDFIFVEIDNNCIAGGEITYISYVKPMDEDGYYALRVNVLGQNVYFDSKGDLRILSYLKKEENYIAYDKDGVSVTELLKKYNLDKNSSVEEIMKVISERWSSLTEEEKDEMTYVFCYYNKETSYEKSTLN